MRNTASKAFTLVEILIVVVILGILAAIVIPQFTNASQDAQKGNVVTQLQTIRNQIELFRVRNNGNNPKLVGAENASFEDFTCGTGTATLTNSYGATQDPYLRTPPINPRNNKNSVTASGAATLAAFTAELLVDPSTTNGWDYNPANGSFGCFGFDEKNNCWFGQPGFGT